jgi:hypothetical protein
MFAGSVVAGAAFLPGVSLLGLTYRLGIIDYAIIVLLLQKYVLGPIALYRMSNATFNAKIRLVADTALIEPNVRAFSEQTERALLSAGFVAPQRIASAMQSPLPGMETLLEHPANGDLANFVAMVNQRSTEMSPLVTVVTFRSAFDDGTLLQTSNFTLAGFSPDRPNHENVVIPEVRDAVELYRLHRARVARKAAAAAQKALTRGDTPEQRLAYATRDQLDTTNFMIECGYRKRSPDGIRLTALGATLTAWRHMFPWKQIGQRQRRRAAAEVVRLA